VVCSHPDDVGIDAAMALDSRLDRIAFWVKNIERELVLAHDMLVRCSFP
jgi:hypothetical protein